MIVEKVTIIFVAIVFIILLSFRYIKRYAPENLVIIPLVTFFSSTYIFFVFNNLYIPIFIQTLIFLFAIFIPLIAVFLQYNNIVLTRKILYYKMKYSYFSKDYDKVIEYITRLVSSEGRKAEYLYILGECYKNKNDFINARDSFALAIELDKNDYRSYYELGLILDETNKKETALAMFNRAIKIKPDFYEAREALGICLTRQGRFREAVLVYKRALEIFPNSYELYYNIAIIEMELGEYENAKEAFENAGKIKPDLYTAFYNLGDLNYLNGNLDNSLEEYKKVLVSRVYGKKAYYKIAKIYALKKEYEKAMSALEYAIELDTSYIQKAKEEAVFKNMNELIERYLQDRELLKEREKDRKNYMKDKLKLFRKKDEEIDISKMDYTRDYSNKENENVEVVKNA